MLRRRDWMTDYICPCKCSDSLAFRAELTLICQSGHMILIVVIDGMKYMVRHEDRLQLPHEPY
jgi:hypothetical protein